MDKQFSASIHTYAMAIVAVDGVEEIGDNLPEMIAMALGQAFLAQIRSEPKKEIGMGIRFHVDDVRHEFNLVTTHDGGLVSATEVK